MDLGLKDKVAIVTGGARGIGRAIALRLAEEGAHVAIADILDATPVVEEIKKMGREALYVKTDITDPEQVKNFVQKVLEKFGKIDILINNAGITRDALIHKMTKEDWDKVIDVNLTGAFNMIKAVVNHFIERKQGKIINISSVVGQRGNIGQANYAASKAGLIGLTKALALELARYGEINVNAVAPGFVKTAMTEKIPEKIKKMFIDMIPFHRFAEPEEIADVVVFLASDRARYITGQVIGVNGGFYT